MMVDKKLTQKYRWGKFAALLMVWVVTTACFVAIYATVDYVFVLTFVLRMVLFTLYLITLGISIYLQLRKLPTLREVAWQIDKDEGFKGHLITLVERKKLIRLPYSKDLLNLVSERANQFKVLPFLKFWRRYLLYPLQVGYISIGVIALTLISPLRYNVSHLFNRNYFSLQLLPGDTELVIGDSLTIKVTPVGVKPHKIYLWVDSTRYVLRQYDGFTFSLIPHRGFTYRAQLADVSTPTYEVDLLVPPWVKRWSIKCRYPTYTGLPPTISDNPNLQVLVGTHVSISGVANTSLAMVDLILGDEPHPAQVYGDSFNFNLIVDSSLNYGVVLHDINGLSSDTCFYSIYVYADEPPEISLLHPLYSQPIPEDAHVRVISRLRDDYGVAKVLLISSCDTIELATFRNVTDTIYDYIWDLNSYGLMPGDTVWFKLRVYDNDTYKGPKYADSPELFVYFPTLEELYTQMERYSEQLNMESTDLQSMIDKLTTKIMELKAHELTDTMREEIGELEQQVEQLRHAVKQFEQQFTHQLERIEDMELLEPETIVKLERIKELTSEIITPEMERLLGEIMDKLRNNPEIWREALSKMEDWMHELEANLDRTIELLENIVNERRLKELMDEATRIKEAWDNLAEQSKVAAPETRKGLSKLVEDLQQDLNTLKAGVDSLVADMYLSTELSRIAQDIPSIQSKMEQAKETMQAGKHPTQLTPSISHDLDKLAQALRSLYEKVSHGTFVMEELQEMERELIQLSHWEEEIATNPGGESPLRQAAICDALHNIKLRYLSLYRKSPFVSEEPLNFIDAAINEMEYTSQLLSQGEHVEATQHATNAMYNINQAISVLSQQQATCQQLACQTQGESSMSMLMQMLNQIAQSHEALTQMAQNILATSGLPRVLGESAHQIATQERELADRLHKVAEGLRGRALGDLGHVADELDKLADRIEQGGITPEIVARQKELLRHMLDAQKSIYTKKFSRRRISEPGQDFTNLIGPKGLNPRTRHGVSQKQIWHALRERFIPYYERYIREYFRKLEE